MPTRRSVLAAGPGPFLFPGAKQLPVRCTARGNERSRAKVYIKILRLPDERLRFRSAWRTRWRATATPRPTAPEDADLVVLNTCHIREKAAEKVYSELGRLREMKEERRARGPQRSRIAVAGCVAQAEGAEIMRRAPAVDLVVGPQSYHRLPELLARVAGRRAVVDTDFRPKTNSIACARADRAARSRSAASPPSSPCRKAATSSARSASCPIRAARKSRGRSATIVAEVERLADAGVREVTLLGQNVNAYHGDGLGRHDRGRSADCCARLARMPGIERLRYTTSHPRDMDDDLIAAHRDLPELMPYLHLPVQSGSDRMLEAMNRRTRARDYLA